MGQPVPDVEEFPDCGLCVVLVDGPRTMDGRVAKPRDNSGLVEHRIPGRGLECWLMDEGAEVVLVRQAEGGVVLIGPVDENLQCSSGVETSGARIRMRDRFSLQRGLVNIGPFGCEKLKVRAHARLSPLIRFSR